MKMGMEFWAAHVEAVKFEAIPASEYARRHGLAVKSLYYWRRKLKALSKANTPVPSSKFVALRIAPGEARQNNVTLELSSGGLCLEMSLLPQPEWLAALVRAVPGTR